MELSKEQLALLTSGQTYINVHSLAHPPGVIRGQVTTEGVYVVRTQLSGDQEVPPVESSASGIGYTTVNTDSGNTFAILQNTGVDDASMVHIHQAVAGENGGVVLPLVQDAEDVSMWQTEEGATLNAEQITAFKNAEMYFNVHTPAHPSGEIRGQIEPDTTK